MSAQKGVLFGYIILLPFYLIFRDIPNVAGFLNHIENLMPKQNFKNYEIILLLKK